MPGIVECIPNFSEGRRSEVIDQIVSAIESISGAVLLDRESDPNHNRSVVTFVASPDCVVDAAIAAANKASELIDLNKHTGEHPRMGAVDVVPLVPIEGVTMPECVALAVIRVTTRSFSPKISLISKCKSGNADMKSDTTAFTSSRV